MKKNKNNHQDKTPQTGLLFLFLQDDYFRPRFETTSFYTGHTPHAFKHIEFCGDECAYKESKQPARYGNCFLPLFCFHVALLGHYL